MTQLIPQSLKNMYHWFQALIAILYFRHPASSLTVLGITGTDGKTTTSFMLHHILRTEGFSAALISTVSALIGQEVIDTGFHTTTPTAWQLQRLLSKAKQAGCRYVILETTSIGLDQYRVMGANIRYAGLTNLAHEHLDYHGTMPRYLKAKLKIASQASVFISHQATIEDTKLASLLPARCKLITLPSKASVIPLRESLNSSYNQQNARLAIALATEIGIKPKNAIEAFQNLPQIPGRLQYIPNSQGLHIVVDFAHTPQGLESVLNHLRQTHTSGRVLAVFGATGRRDVKKRPIMGQIVSKLADLCIITSDDCYDESVEQIIHHIKSGIDEHNHKVVSFKDRPQAIQFALTQAKRGDVVAVLGKGHEQSINIHNQDMPYNDAQVITSLLASKSASRPKTRSI